MKAANPRGSFENEFGIPNEVQQLFILCKHHQKSKKCLEKQMVNPEIPGGTMVTCSDSRF
jgi:hypothetical protein